MSIFMSHNNYGKSSVRVAKVARHPDRHDFKEITVDIQFEGDFESVYTIGDNSKVLPTDTMKNTVYALAKDHPLGSIEEFGISLGGHFLKNNPQASRVTIALIERLWQRILVSQKNGDAVAHPHAFTGGGSEKWTSVVTLSRDAIAVESGLKNLLILKTTDSGFSNFLRDRFTTLKETGDRIFATDLLASWRYQTHEAAFESCRQIIRKAIIETFARHHSLSVQHTLYACGRAALEARPEVAEIRLAMPNKHFLPVDLKPFGMENQNEIFVPTDEPHGLIEATLKREG